MLASLPQVSVWVAGQRYAAGAVNTFLQVADYYLVSRALAHGDIVVTHEVPSGSVNKVKIPDVCGRCGCGPPERRRHGCG